MYIDIKVSRPGLSLLESKLLFSYRFSFCRPRPKAMSSDGWRRTDRGVLRDDRAPSEACHARKLNLGPRILLPKRGRFFSYIFYISALFCSILLIGVNPLFIPTFVSYFHTSCLSSAVSLVVSSVLFKP